ncbi:O-methyltransferase [Lentzea sp. NBRC 105346]|uniref:methyltransferase n=1 Tax=Lentzea sp. NBRC 105346 TaxID=3032205 RepID=UPI002555A5C1|nr:methyltransferase [Lentzea sp. NBRC 105346]GLZ33832.1 O-methyltransferase [Lentzea sp. NBRC 105346]
MEWSAERGVDLGGVMAMARSFYQSQLLLNAVKLGVFTALGEGPASAEQLRERLELHPRGARDFFDALVSIGLLVRDGELYSNGSTAANHLDKNKPQAYLGGFLGLSGDIYPLWANLAESLKTGNPQVNKDHIFEIYSGPEQQQREFFDTMSTVTRMSAPDVAKAVDWSRYKSFVDVGGSIGTLAATIVQAHPHLQATCLDLPLIEPHFTRTVNELGVAEQVTFQGADFFNEPLPEADVLILAHILHDWDIEQRRTLLNKAFEAVRPGGAVVVLDTMIDDERSDRGHALLMSLDMLLFSPGGSEYTFGELCVWFAEAGFVRPSAHLIANGFECLAIAHKPA